MLMAVAVAVAVVVMGKMVMVLEDSFDRNN